MKKILNPNRLKSRRCELGISKLEAAKRMYLTQSGYVRYESGERNPSYPTIIVMANVLETSPEYLTDETDDPQPDYIIVSKNDNSDLYNILEHITKADMSKKESLILSLKKTLSIK